MGIPRTEDLLRRQAEATVRQRIKRRRRQLETGEPGGAAGARLARDAAFVRAATGADRAEGVTLPSGHFITGYQLAVWQAIEAGHAPS